MNLQSFQYFVVLARERNYTHAARALHITQQSLSAHIAALEKELGCGLIVRQTPLALTCAGKAFLRYAAEICSLREEMYQELCDIRNDQAGELRVGVAYTRGRAIMPQIVTAFQERYPRVEVTIIGGTNEELRQLLSKGRLDLAIANFSRDAADIETSEFYTEDMALLISEELLRRSAVDLEAHRADLEQGNLSALRDCPFLLGSEADIAGHMSRRMLEASGVRPAVRVRSDNIEILLDLCAQGEGVCFCPERLAHAALSGAQLERLRVLRFAEQWAVPIYFGYTQRVCQPRLVAEFIRIAGSVDFDQPAHPEVPEPLRKAISL